MLLSPLVPQVLQQVLVPLLGLQLLPVNVDTCLPCTARQVPHQPGCQVGQIIGLLAVSLQFNSKLVIREALPRGASGSRLPREGRIQKQPSCPTGLWTLEALLPVLNRRSGLTLVEGKAFKLSPSQRSTQLFSSQHPACQRAVPVGPFQAVAFLPVASFNVGFARLLQALPPLPLVELSVTRLSRRHSSQAKALRMPTICLMVGCPALPSSVKGRFLSDPFRRFRTSHSALVPSLC